VERLVARRRGGEVVSFKKRNVSSAAERKKGDKKQALN